MSSIICHVIRCRQALLSTATQRSTSTRRGGFTLVELAVVIAIALILTAITVGGVNSMTAGNQRVACQTNLVQIYQATRLYAADADGNFPLYSRPAAGPTPSATPYVGIGLWALYTYPKDGASAEIASVGTKPIERYLRSLKSLHCPVDYDFPRASNGAALPNANGVMIQNSSPYQASEDVNHNSVLDSGEDTNGNGILDTERTIFNPNYCSYQVWSDTRPVPLLPTGSPRYPNLVSENQWTYHPSRDGGKRQLLQTSGRPPADDTVVAWCIWHRTGSGGRQYDNVLFYDGTVQYLPRQETPRSVDGASCIDQTLSTSCVNGWQRTPKAPS